MRFSQEPSKPTQSQCFTNLISMVRSFLGQLNKTEKPFSLQDDEMTDKLTII